MRRKRWFAAVALAVGFVAAGEAAAQTDVCQALSAQLAKLDRGGAPVDGLSEALLRQRAALQRGAADYQRHCQSFGFFSSPPPQCPSLQARLQEMQANLERLEARTQRAGAAAVPSADSAADRARIIAVMRQSGCTPGVPGPTPPGTITAASGRPAQNGPAPVAAGRVGPNGERYFTLPSANGPVTYREDASGRVSRIEGGPPPSRVAAVPPRGGGFLSTIFGDRAPGVTYPDDPYASGPSGEAEPGPIEDGGAYRTLCVRMCDGYYFPISFSTNRSRFGTDGEICRARCPGAETRLFAHRTGDDSETAVSADDVGVPYTKIPNALRYRTEFVSGCGCGRPDPSLLPVNASSDEGANSGSATVKVGDVRADLPLPRAKPEADEDPETRANALASFVPSPVEAVKAGEASSGLRGPTNGPKPVRVIGPKFFATR